MVFALEILFRRMFERKIPMLAKKIPKNIWGDNRVKNQIYFETMFL